MAPERREGDWDCPRCGNLVFARNSECPRCGYTLAKDQKKNKKRGRWEWEPAKKSHQRREGDWECSSCGVLNFAYRDACFKCDAPKAEEDTRDEEPEGEPEDFLEDAEPFEEVEEQLEDELPEDQDPDDVHEEPEEMAQEEEDPPEEITQEEVDPGRPRKRRREGRERAPWRNPSEGKGAKPWKQGDWSCPSCGAHNFAKRSACFQCGAEKERVEEGIYESVDTSVAPRSPPNPPMASASAPLASPMGEAIKTLARQSHRFRRAWVGYCRASQRENSDPCTCERSFLMQFLDRVADLLEKDAALASPGSAPPKPETTTLTMRKSVVERIKKLNKTAALKQEIRIPAVALYLSRLDEAQALEVLARLEETADEVDDPDQFLRSESGRLVDL
mmetsp:Transcript_40918/g.91511  ORF Transcript_40918/g.91511 Transcript_40918/m.91511 type:complete len:390 (-) Transcript_40918:33-1202(-)